MLLWLITHNHCAQFAPPGLGPRKQRAAAGAPRYVLIRSMKRSWALLNLVILSACGGGSNDDALSRTIQGLWRSSCNLEQISYVRREIEFWEGSVALRIDAFDEPDCQTSGLSITKEGVYTIGVAAISSEGRRVGTVDISWIDQSGDVGEVEKTAVDIEGDVLYLGEFDEATGIPTIDYDVEWVRTN